MRSPLPVRLVRLAALVLCFATVVGVVASATRATPELPWPEGLLVEYTSSDQPTLTPTDYSTLFVLRNRVAEFRDYGRAVRRPSRVICLSKRRMRSLRRLLRRAARLPARIRARPYPVRGRQLLLYGPGGRREVVTLPSSELPRARSRAVRRLLRVLEHVKRQAAQGPRLRGDSPCR